MSLEANKRELADGDAQVLYGHTAPEDQQRPSQGMPNKPNAVLSTCHACRGRERQRHAHNEEETRKYRVSESPAIPCRVREFAVAVLVRELRVHKDHRDDGSATKDVDGLQSR